jgi:hypothetical protein
MQVWTNASEKLKEIYVLFEIFSEERNKNNDSEKWNLKTISEHPLVLEIDFNGVTHEITDDELAEKETDILFTQFLKSKTKEELLFKMISQIIFEKFELK